MRWKDHIVLLVVSALFFLPFLGWVHLFDWDEINFAESAREMLLSGNWYQVQINFEPFWEKPPLFFWMQAASMHLFGVNEFAARLPNALAGMMTLQVLFALGIRTHHRKLAWVWALLYLGSFLPHLYFKSGIIDPWFNLFIFLGVYFLYRVFQDPGKPSIGSASFSGLCIGLAILTKGPVGLLLLILSLLTWLAWHRFSVKLPWREVLAFTAACFLTSSLWFGYETLQNGPWFLMEFIAYQIDLFLHPVAGHKQPFFYHFVVVLLGCFPISILALPAFSRAFRGDNHGFSKWMKSLFWVVMILFSIVTTKIVHYSSMAYLPLSYLAALVVSRQVSREASIPRWQSTWMYVQGGLIALLLVLAPIALMTKDTWAMDIADPFARGNLSVSLGLGGWEWLPGLAYLGLVIWSIRLWRQRSRNFVPALALGGAAVISATMVVLVPHIEHISQRSAIEFFESQRGKDVHLETYGYKSYAHYFYGRITPETSHRFDEHALQDSSKPVMVSAKVQHAERFEQEYPEAKRLYDAGGFVFYRLAD